MEITGIKISQLNPIPEDWTEEQIANLMNVGLIPISLESMEETFKATLGLVLSYAIGKSNSAESIAEEYSPDKPYKKSEFCLHERNLYVAKTDMPAGDWDENNWSKVPLSFYVNKIPFMIALQYNKDSTYNRGDYCCNDYAFYKCRENNTTGTFNITKWDSVNVAQELRGLWDAVKGLDRLSKFTDDITLQAYTPTGTANAKPISSSALANFGTLIISPSYVPENIYNRGNICFKDGLMYESLENNVTGVWDASKWQQTTLANYLLHAVNSLADTYIYVDPVYGDDNQDGLGKHTPVKTIVGAIQAYKTATASDNAKYLSSNFSVYILNGYRKYVRLPSNTEFAELGQRVSANGIYIYGQNIYVENDRLNPNYDISYPIHIKGGIVETEISGSSGYSASSSITIDCDYLSQLLALTTGNITVNSVGLIDVTAVGVSETTSTYPDLKLNSKSGIITFANSSGGRYFNAIELKSYDDLNINCELHCNNGTCVLSSEKGSVNFSKPIVATEHNTVINAGKNISNTAGFFTAGLDLIAGGTVTTGGSCEITGKVYLKCDEYIVYPGTNSYEDDFVAEVRKFNSNGSNNGFFKKKFDITCSGDIDLYAITFCNDVRIRGYKGTCNVYTMQSYNLSSIPEENSKYILDLGSMDLYTKYSSIQNQYAAVIIKTTGDVVFGVNGTPGYCKLLDLQCSNFKLNTGFSVGYFKIDVSGTIEQVDLSNGITMALEYGDEGSGSNADSDYISYDTAYNNTLKANALYWSSTGNADYYGLIKTYYGNAVKNINIDINMLIAPSYSGGGNVSPSVLGPCLSGSDTFNSIISGTIGGFVFQNGSKVSSWGHDISRIPDSYYTTNPNARVTLKWDNYVETLHFYYDPNQGNDAFDGVTRKTPVKTFARLISLIKNANDGNGCSYINNGSYTYLNVGTCITIHILSAYIHNSRGNTSTSPTSVGFWNFSDSSATIVDTMDIYEYTTEYGNVPVMFNMLEIIPEAPDLQISIRSLNANLLYIHDFDAVKIVGLAGGNYGSYNLKYIQANTCVIINNSWSFNIPYYSNVVGPVSIQSYNIGICGCFNSISAKAQAYVYIADSTGGPSGSSSNCMIQGTSIIEGDEIHLGNNYYSSDYPSYIGISGLCYIKARYRVMDAYIDDVSGCLYIDSGEDFSGSVAGSYFKGEVHIKASKTIEFIKTTSFGSYSSDPGMGGLIKLEARTITGNLSSIFSSDLYVKCITWNNSNTIYLYGGGNINQSGSVVNSTEPSKAYFDINTLNTSIYYYGYEVFANIEKVNASLVMNGGGPFYPLRTALHFRYGSCTSPVAYLSSGFPPPSYNGSTIVYTIEGSCRQTSAPVFYCSNMSESWSLHGSLNVRVDFSKLQSDDAYGEFPDGLDFDHDIIILNMSKRLVAGQGITVTDNGDNIVIALDSTIESILQQINTQLENATGNTGMYDLGDKTEADLVDGKLTISTGNSTTNLTLTTISAITFVSNQGVPNFAVLIDNSLNASNVEVTVTTSDGHVILMNSVNQGTTVEAGKIMQLTAVGDCWTIAEFEGGGEEGSGS